ncbi:MAG: polyprenol monophosphomannose synthase [Candidatus Micrarchaeia archaeon]
MLSILLPTYNESENIGLVIEAIEKAVPAPHEIIVIDDGSPDGTARVVKGLMGRFPSLRLLERGGKLGLTSAIAAGVSASKGEAILVMDADLSHPPSAIPAMASALADSGLAVGSRLIEGGGVQSWPLHRRLISLCAGILCSLLLNPRCSDPLSGFFAVRKDVFLRTRIRTRGYKILMNIIADNRGIRISEVPYVFRDRHAGKTKLGSKEIVTYLGDLYRVAFC